MWGGEENETDSVSILHVAVDITRSNILRERWKGREGQEERRRERGRRGEGRKRGGRGGEEGGSVYERECARVWAYVREIE